jgi:hypothetical protein
LQARTSALIKHEGGAERQMVRIAITGTKIFITGGEHDLTEQHRSSGAGQAAGRTGRGRRHFVVHSAEVRMVNTDGIARRKKRGGLRFH